MLPSNDHCTWSPLVPLPAVKVKVPVPQRVWLDKPVTVPGTWFAVAVAVAQPLIQPVVLLRVRAYIVIVVPAVNDVVVYEPDEPSVSAMVLPSVDHCTWSPLAPAVAVIVTAPAPHIAVLANEVTTDGIRFAVAVTLVQPLKQPVVLLRVRAKTVVNVPAVNDAVVKEPDEPSVSTTVLPFNDH